MTKSYKRDIQILLKMLANIDSARDVITRYRVNFASNSQYSLHLNKDAFDLCAFYLAQFGEKVKLLTDTTRHDLSTIVDLSILKYFRNIIDHDYESVNKVILMSYIQLLTSNDFRNAVIKRIDYCKQNKR